MRTPVRIGSIIAASGWIVLVAVLGWLDDQTGPTLRLRLRVSPAGAGRRVAPWPARRSGRGGGRERGVVRLRSSRGAVDARDRRAVERGQPQLSVLRRRGARRASAARPRAPHRERCAARTFPARHRARAAAAGRIAVADARSTSARDECCKGRRSRSYAAMRSACSSSRATSSRWDGCNRSRCGWCASPSICAR